MAKMLDLGCGYERERQLPGADLCNCNLGEGGVVLEPGQRFFAEFASTEDPLPVPDGEYDLVWYTNGWYTCSITIRKKIAKEISRITKSRATLILRDYTMYVCDDGDVTITPRQWMRMVRECFKDWNVDAFYVEIEYNLDDPKEKTPLPGEYPGATDKSIDYSMCAILKKGWG